MKWANAVGRASTFSAGLIVLALMMTVIAPVALGDPPSSECASTDPAWNGEYWKVTNSDSLTDVDTNVPGAATLSGDGSWTNNNESTVFRVVMSVGKGAGEDQVLSGTWETGDGGNIDLNLAGLGHVTFCFSADIAGESEPTTTTLAPTTTTIVVATTTTASTVPGTSTTTPGETTTTIQPDDGTAATPANGDQVDDPSMTSTTTLPSDSVEGVEVLGSAHEWSSTDADRDTTVAAAGIGESGGPPGPGQASIASDAIGAELAAHEWPTPGDLAVIAGLVAAIGVVMSRGRIRRGWRRMRAGRGDAE